MSKTPTARFGYQTYPCGNERPQTLAALPSGLGSGGGADLELDSRVMVSA